MTLLGCGLGLGLVGLGRAGTVQRPSLRALQKVVNGPAAQRAEGEPGAIPRWRLDQRLGFRLASELHRRDTTHAMAGMVATSGRTLDALCAEVVLGAVAGTGLPIFCWLLVSASGTQVSTVPLVCVAAILGICGATTPFIVLRLESTKRRSASRRIIGSFLDLVVLCLAGGMGVESALYSAAQVGQDDLSRRLADALVLARDSATSPWRALALLGEEMGLTELQEIAVAVGLAGTEGAQIRATLVAKATSVRRHELAEAEAQANAVTQRLFLPGVLLLLGFLLFIGFPAVERIMNGI